MTKRPPEMVELDRFTPVHRYGLPSMGESAIGAYVSAEQAESAIRSLRVKLFRERARNHGIKVLRLNEILVDPRLARHRAADIKQKNFHMRAARRFASIADAIERGEQ